MQVSKRIKEIIRQISRRRVSKIIYKIASPLINEIGVRTNPDIREINKVKETILVVSHEASITGAPILALNICKELSNKYNIITLILRDGELTEEFKAISEISISPRFSILTGGMLRKALSKIKLKHGIKYAVVNSIVSARAIQPLRDNGIPVMTLIHELCIYKTTQPNGIGRDYGQMQ